MTYAYNTSGDLTSVTNGLGHAATYANYTALGLPGRTTSSNGAVSNFTYDARGRVLTASDVVGGVAQTTIFTYDPAGRLETVTMPDGQQTRNAYDAAGRLVSTSETESATTSAQTLYQYNTNSQPIEVKRQRTTSP
jgi:YD repeat-containing protein